MCGLVGIGCVECVHAPPIHIQFTADKIFKILENAQVCQPEIGVGVGGGEVGEICWEKGGWFCLVDRNGVGMD